MEYKEFKVIVQNEDSVRIIRPDQTHPEGNIDKSPLRRRTIKIFHKWLAKGSITTSEELKVLGAHLFELLFDEKISSYFKADFDSVKQEGASRLRLVLEFEEKAVRAGLAELPWEYIYYPGRPPEPGFFLATENKLILTRYVTRVAPLKDLMPHQKPLSILLVVSRPDREPNGTDLDVIQAEETIKAIQGLKKSRLGQAITVKTLYDPGHAELEKTLREIKPHVMHFIGHGYLDKAGKGWLALTQGQGKGRKVAAWISDELFASCLTNRDDDDYSPPRLVFLHACEGARSSSYETFGGMALSLVCSHIPAVVAMQYKVQNQVANLFSSAFYDALGQGNPIDVAVQKGRLKLIEYLRDDTREFSRQAFGSPVVFLQSADGIIIAENPEEAKGQDDAAAQGKMKTQEKPYQCPGCDKRYASFKEECFNCGEKLSLCPTHNIVFFREGVCPRCKNTDTLSVQLSAAPRSPDYPVTPGVGAGTMATRPAVPAASHATRATHQDNERISISRSLPDE